MIQIIKGEGSSGLMSRGMNNEHAGYLSCPQARNCLILRPPGTVGQLYAIRCGGCLAGHQMPVLQCTAVYNQGLMPVMLAWQYSALSQYDILFLWGETELLTWQSECWLLVGDVVISPPGTAARLESCLQWPGLLMIQFRRSLSSLASCGFRFLCWTLSSHIHIQYILEKIKKSNELVIVDSGHFLFEFNDRQNIKKLCERSVLMPRIFHQ